MLDVMKGIRILEVAEHTFVPAASAILAEWGADVIKVEHAERGDAMRGLAQTGVVTYATKVHVLMEHSNRAKRSIGIDLSKPPANGLAQRSKNMRFRGKSKEQWFRRKWNLPKCKESDVV